MKQKTQYKQTPIGFIPADWEVKKLGELTVGKGTYGINASAVEYNELLPKYLRITDIDGEGYFSVDKLSSVNDSSSKDFYLEENDIVFVRTGSTTGKSYLYNPNDGLLVYAGFLIKFSLDKSKVDKYYIWSFTKSDKYNDWVNTFSQRSGQPGLNSNEYASLLIPLPPLPEQQKIAEILSTWDKAITTTEQLLTNSQQQKKALMQQLLTGKKRLLDEDGVRFSGEWLSKFLGDFCEISTGKSNREDSTSSSGMYTFFDRSQDIRTSNIFLFDAEAVIVAGEGQEFVPKHFSGKFDLHQRTYAIMGFANSWGKFIYFYLGHFNSFLLSQAVGSTVKSLRLPMFQKLPIKLPAFKEQPKIATVLTTADREIELLQAKLEALKQEKKALMQQLLTGKRRVNFKGGNDE